MATIYRTDDKKQYAVVGYDPVAGAWNVGTGKTLRSALAGVERSEHPATFSPTEVADTLFATADYRRDGTRRIEISTSRDGDPTNVVQVI